MCDQYIACKCLRKRLPRYKPFNMLLLDCWQREYDRRPYRNFRFKRIEFEERLERIYHPIVDFKIIVQFLRERSLCTAHLTGVRVLSGEPYNDGVDLVYDFAESLIKLSSIELVLMEIPRRFFTLLNENAVRMKNLKNLSFQGTPLHDDDIIALRAFLIASDTLQYLNVASCGVNQYNFALLADGIHKSTSMRGFKCNRLLGGYNTSLDTAKIAHIVASLIWQNKLEDIEMQHCEFIAHDMETISEYMANKSSKLSHLNLANNNIACDGAEHLLCAIVRSATLTHLNISGNGLGTHGGEVIAKYLSSCYRLQYLNITYNGMGSEAVNAILLCMKKPIKLKKLQIWGNQFDQRSANILRRLLDSLVLPQETIDITSTYDEIIYDYRVIPFF